MKTLSITTSASIVLSLLTTLSFAAARRDSARATTPPKAPTVARQCCPTIGGAVNILKPRPLKDADLSDADNRRYTVSTSTVEKQLNTPTRASQQTNITQPIAAQFRLGSIQLRYGQETKAMESFTKAWTELPDLMKEAKSTTAAASLVRTHLIELQKLIPKDPAFVLAVMSTLAPQHEAAFKAITQTKLKPQLAMPLAATWVQLTQFGQLDKDSLEKAAPWMLMYPNLVAANRPLPPELRSEYDSELTQVSIKINERIRMLAERQRAQVLGARAPMPPNPNAEAQGNDPMLQQTMANLDNKRGPIMQFMNADIAFRYGQFQDGIQASAQGWKELVGVYRSGGGASPADTDLHFDDLTQIATANPVQAVVLLNELDPAYRTIAQMTPFISSKVADTWIKLATELPLHANMLEKAVAWAELAGSANKDIQARYTSSLTELKKRLEEAKKTEEVASDTTEKEITTHNRGRTARNETPPSNDQSKQTGHGRISIPKALGPSGSGQ